MTDLETCEKELVYQTAVGTIRVHIGFQNRSVNNCFIIIAVSLVKMRIFAYA
jgi:hypothetical protein